MLKEFKAFAMRGNLIDMAVGVVIGAAFGAVTKVFIDGLFMPLIGLIFQMGDLNDWKILLAEAKDKTPANYLMIGSFISTVINFLIIAFAMFMVVKGMNAMKKKEAAAPPAAPPAPSNQEILLGEIRDLLKNK